MPDIDAKEATDVAFELYDTDGDGSLNRVELKQCPGVKDAIYVYDADGNGLISMGEMENRIAAWKNGPAMMTLECGVTLDGKPLEGTLVEYVPEECLQEWLQTASGITGPDGITSIGIPAEFLPATHQRVRALYAGVYKIKITHPERSIPEKYNTRTTLGHEVSRETVGSPPFHECRLTSK